MEYELSIERERKANEKQDTSGFKEINIKKNAWIKIPSKEIFNIWNKYKGDCFIEVICPYCFEITSIWSSTKDNRLRLKCSCEIPENPTPKLIEVILNS